MCTYLEKKIKIKKKVEEKKGKGVTVLSEICSDWITFWKIMISFSSSFLRLEDF